jgi:uncharacterized membrane protein
MSWGVLGAAILPSLLAGTEISLITAGASRERGWGKAWAATFAGLLTMVPIAALLYLFFTRLSHDVMEYLAGGVVFLLGLYFAVKGFRGRHKHEQEEKEKKGLSGGLLGAYGAVVGEGLEMTTVVTALGAEAGNAFFAAWIGEAIGIGVVLALLVFIRPLLERIPGWAFQLAVGVIMMGLSAVLMFFGGRE